MNNDKSKLCKSSLKTCMIAKPTLTARRDYSEGFVAQPRIDRESSASRRGTAQRTTVLMLWP